MGNESNKDTDRIRIEAEKVEKVNVDKVDKEKENNEKNKKRNKRKRIIFALILLAALAYFLCYTGIHKDDLISTEETLVSYEPASDRDAKEIYLENDVEYKSLIIPEQDGDLTNVTIRLKKVEPDFTGNLVFRICGDDGEEKIRMEVSKEGLLADTIDYVSVFNMTVPVSKGEKIWVSWMVTGNEGTPTCIYLYDNEDGEVIIDGSSMSGKSLQQIGYMNVRYAMICGWIVLMPIIISIAVLVLLFFDGKAVRYVRRVAAAALPLLALFLWLLSTDNLAFWGGENFLPELVGLYLILGIVLCVFDLRGGSIFYLGFVLTFTLVNYFMQAFRGQPLLVTDIFSLRTALKVAGNYTYDMSYTMVSIVMVYVDMLVMMITYSYAPKCIEEEAPEQKELAKKPEKIEKAENTEKVENTKKTENTKKVEQAENTEKIEKVEKAEKTEKTQDDPGNAEESIKKKICKKKKLLIRLCGGVLCLAAYVGLGEYTDFYISSWDMSAAFTEHGWLMTNTMLMKICLNNKPDGYNKENTEKFIAEKAANAGKAETAGNTRNAGEAGKTENSSIAENAGNASQDAKVTPENLIVIMDESFADLSVLGDLETDAEVMPFLDSLENGSRVEKGYMGVHVFGGGTISTEWEFLTGGNTLLMNIGSLYPYTLLQSKTKKYNYEGIGSFLADAGYETIAMHPGWPSSYRRDAVYPLLGFQTFLSLDNYYEDADQCRNFVSDQGDFDGIIEQYENKESDDLFVFNVTIQNHGGYSDQLDEYDVSATNIDCNELDLYLTLAHRTDQALEKLLDYFSEVDEPTMIVFFGDHQPSLPDGFYDDLYGEHELDDEQIEKKFVTPYLIWSNYDRTTYDKPYINTGYLKAIVKSEAGFILNQWDQYLLGIMEEYPVVGQYGLFDEEYNFTSYNEMDEEQTQAVKQMQHAMYYWWTHH